MTDHSISGSYDRRADQTNGLAPPRASDPLRLAGVTVKAVNQIGAEAAAEIDQAAAAFEEGAAEVTAKLRELATAVREHSRIAGEQVEQFCGKATNVIEGLRALRERLDRPGANGAHAPD